MVRLILKSLLYLFLFFSCAPEITNYPAGTVLIDDKAIMPYKSKFLGKTYEVSKLLSFYKACKGDSDDKKRFCNKYGDFLGSEFAFGKGKPGYNLLPRGTKLKIINSYMTRHREASMRAFNSDIAYVSAELENGSKVIFMEKGFDLNVVRASGDEMAEFLPDFSEFDKNKGFSGLYCKSHNEYSIKLFYSEFKKSFNYYIEYLKDVIVKRVDFIKNNKVHSCLDLKFSDKHSFIVFKHRISSKKYQLTEFLLKGEVVCSLEETQKCFKITYKEDLFL